MDDIIEQFKVVFDLDDKPLQDGIKNTETSIKGLGKIFGAVFASIVSYGAIKAITQDYVNLNLKLFDSSSLLKESAGEVQALGNALQRFGGNTEDAISSLSSLQDNLEAAKRGEGSLIEVTKKFGVAFDPYKSASENLKLLAPQLAKMSVSQRKFIGQQLGLSDSIIRAYSDGGKELDKFLAQQERLGTVTEEDKKVSSEFANANLFLGETFQAITRDLARVVLPAFTKLVDLFSEFILWAREHKAVVIGFFAGLLIAMTPILIAFGEMAVASVSAFAPLYAVVGVVTAISLIFEDLLYYFRGYDSATGDLVKKFPILANILEGIRPIVVGIADTFNKIVDFLKDPSWKSFSDIFKTAGQALYDFLIQPFDALSKMIFGLSLDNLISSIKQVGTSIIDFIMSPFKSIADFISNITLDNLFSSIKDVGNAIPSFIMSPFDNLEEVFNNMLDPLKEIKEVASGVFDKIGKFFGFGDDKKKLQPVAIPQAPNIPNSTTNRTQNNYNVNNNFNQNISSATPKQLADNTNRNIVQSINLQRQQQGAL